MLGKFFKKNKISDLETIKLEEDLIKADINYRLAKRIINYIQKSNKQNAIEALQDFCQKAIKPVEKQFSLTGKPHVIFILGVNGVGKTTTIGKLCHLMKPNYKLMLAAADTFRVAAIEQLKFWGDRNDVPVIAQKTGSDSASVVYDAIESARAKNIDVLIVDTSGRLHNRDDLMAELQRIDKVAKKIMPDAPHDNFLVLDSNAGNNSITQIEQFNKTLKLTGLIYTKFDSSAKAGSILEAAIKFKIPLYFLGIGEKLEDLKLFNANEFISKIIAD